MNEVRFGMLADFSGPSQYVSSFADWWSRLLDLIRYGEELGFDGVWIGEHHFNNDGFAASPLLMAAALARETTRLRLASYVALLPLYNALRLAEEAAAVDVISNGRLEFGVGLGYRQMELEAFGIEREQRRAMMDEGLAVIRGLWTTEAFSFHGEHYAFDALTMTPRPVQRPHPPIWLAARTKGAARRAARAGADLALMGGNSITQAYRDERAALGLEGEGRVSVFRPFFVARDPERALAEWQAHFEHFGARHAAWVGADQDTSFDAQVAATWGDPMRGMNYLHGTPEACLGELRSYHARKPFTEMIAPIAPPYDTDAAAESMELFAREVMEPFKAASRAPV
jgi:alkanesulfonate monooxygenase SsuD/methylene tetrahydromethanopterin reductase-like flavin-dependent oxidoreductase (luciferase family)